jgi:hypothetical protein
MKAHENLVRKPEGKRLLGRPAHSWENNIKLDLKELIWEGIDWLTADIIVGIL